MYDANSTMLDLAIVFSGEEIGLKITVNDLQFVAVFQSINK